MMVPGRSSGRPSGSAEGPELCLPRAQPPPSAAGGSNAPVLAVTASAPDRVRPASPSDTPTTKPSPCRRAARACAARPRGARPRGPPPRDGPGPPRGWPRARQSARTRPASPGQGGRARRPGRASRTTADRPAIASPIGTITPRSSTSRAGSSGCAPASRQPRRASPCSADLDRVSTFRGGLPAPLVLTHSRPRPIPPPRSVPARASLSSIARRAAPNAGSRAGAVATRRWGRAPPRLP